MSRCSEMADARDALASVARYVVMSMTAVMDTLSFQRMTPDSCCRQKRKVAVEDRRFVIGGERAEGAVRKSSVN